MGGKTSDILKFSLLPFRIPLYPSGPQVGVEPTQGTARRSGPQVGVKPSQGTARQSGPQVGVKPTQGSARRTPQTQLTHPARSKVVPRAQSAYLWLPVIPPRPPRAERYRPLGTS